MTGLYKSIILFFAATIIISWFKLPQQQQVIEEVKQPVPVVTVHEVVRPRDLSQEELECLALNIYFEARNQSIDSQIAVSMVVLNRTKDSFWPDTVCDVVKQGSYSDGTVKRNRCQFAWYCDGLSDKPYEQEVWKLVNNVAASSHYLWVTGNDITNGSTNYHAKYVTPIWVNDYNMFYTTTVGDHLFYRWNTRQTVDFN